MMATLPYPGGKRLAKNDHSARGSFYYEVCR